MDKAFAPADIESRIYAHWEASGYFAPSGHGPAYSIVIPPPNVTGTLHMGHAFQDTIMDALIRYRRMRGFDTLVAAGHGSRRHRHADGGGAAAERRGLEPHRARPRGVRRTGLGMEEHVRRPDRAAVAPTGRLGRLERDKFTMDPELSQAVTEAFVRLYDEGLIYRGKRLVNWDPVLKTALSDLEVVAEEEPGSLWHLRYPLGDGSGYLVVATTRPETMLGDTAVAVHPDDERYRHLIGRRLRLPLTEREIPIIARRLRRSGVRQRLRQDHARARFQRLRSRTAARLAHDQHHDARGGAQRERAGAPIAGSTAPPRARVSSPISAPWV